MNQALSPKSRSMQQKLGERHNSLHANACQPAKKIKPRNTMAKANGTYVNPKFSVSQTQLYSVLVASLLSLNLSKFKGELAVSLRKPG